jgi:uncharacterized protein (DUF362 family)/ferredoxin
MHSSSALKEDIVAMLGGKVNFYRVSDSLHDIIETVFSQSRLPGNADALILIKPNLNNDLIGLTGNSTDLRVLSRVVLELQKRGYYNIVVADGPNLGIARTGADVLRRLGVTNLCKALGVRSVDTNKMKSVRCDLGNNLKTEIAHIYFQADFFINIPSIKTHAETLLSCCMKNYIGINAQQCKRQMHKQLAGSIVALNRLLPADLNLVDGLIAMEGNGPGNGIPRRLDWIVSGENSALTDAVIARLLGLDPLREIPYLRESLRQGLILKEEVPQIYGISPLVHIIKPDPIKLVTRVFGHRLLGCVRDAIRPVFDNKTVRPLLYRQGIVQDLYDPAEAQVRYEFADNNGCSNCLQCIPYCPIELSLEVFLDKAKGCIQCGYCFWICNSNKIRMVGDKGYLFKHIERYKSYVEKLIS